MFRTKNVCGENVLARTQFREQMHFHIDRVNAFNYAIKQFVVAN